MENLNPFFFSLSFISFGLVKIAGDLLDLVGDNAFETVQDVIMVRSRLCQAYLFILYILNWWFLFFVSVVITNVINLVSYHHFAMSCRIANTSPLPLLFMSAN